MNILIFEKYYKNYFIISLQGKIYWRKNRITSWFYQLKLKIWFHIIVIETSRLMLQNSFVLFYDNYLLFSLYQNSS